MKREYPKDRNWYKGNLHSHTTNSDGTLSPEEAVARYQEAGYSFLCLSDHDLYTDYREQFDTEDFIILPGVEASAVLFDEQDGCVKLHHMNGILGNNEMQMNCRSGVFHHMERIEPMIFYKDWDGKKVLMEMAKKLRNHGCFITYNHPVWSRVNAEEFEAEGQYQSLEIYNYNTVNESGTGYNITYWDEMLRKGYHINADASDDNHNGSFPDNFGGYIMVCAEELTQEAVMNAVLEGNYYSSNGPEIKEYTLEENKLTIKCSPVERINIIAGGYVGAGTTILAKENECITEAQITVSGTENYIRIECIDQYGKTAWSNPYYISKGDFVNEK